MIQESLVIVVRAIISFGSLLIYTRLLGKQQMGNLTYFDYINGITMGSIAATIATDLSSTAWVHWLGLSTYVFISLIIQHIDVKSRLFSKMIDSEPVILMQHGKILEKALKQTKLTYDQLMMLLRRRNIFDLTQVEYALLEPDGNLSVLRKSEYQALTPKDVNIPVSPGMITTEIIIDGMIIEQNLKQRKKDKAWLAEQLQTMGVSLRDVAFAAILPNDQLYVDLFSDQIDESKAKIEDYNNEPD